MMHSLVPLSTITADIQRIKQRSPLVHCLTNDVVQSLTANLLLAINAIPAMVIASQEINEFTCQADSLLINIGTLHDSQYQSMLLAAAAAQQHNIPWVLDPVAVTLSDYRQTAVTQLLTYQPTVIRGNPAEILALAGYPSQCRGPHSPVASQQAIIAAQQLANHQHCIVAVTGLTDYITDGHTTLAIPWGDPLLTRITGSGCALAALIAAFLVDSTDPLISCATACALQALAGQHAARYSHGPGTFSAYFIDTLYQAPDSLLKEYTVCHSI